MFKVQSLMFNVQWKKGEEVKEKINNLKCRDINLKLH